MRSTCLSIVFAAILLISLSSCGEDPATGPGGLDFAGNNGLVADGVMIGKVNFSGPGTATSTSGESPMTRVALGGVHYFDIISLEVIFPSITPGTYNWNNLIVSNDPKSRSHVKITITGSAEKITLVPVNGSTVVKTYNGGSGGNEITGEFSGTLKTADGRYTVKVDSKFTAFRD